MYTKEQVDYLLAEKQKLQSENRSYEWQLDWFQTNYPVEYAVMLAEQALESEVIEKGKDDE